MVRYISHSADESISLGRAFGKSLSKGAIVCFFGDLAAGKTTFIKGVVESTTGCENQEVISPTFVYLNIYQGKTTLYHFDLYRLKNVEQFLSMGFDEFLFSTGICCIEWSERISELLPKQCIHVKIGHLGDSSRDIEIVGQE